MNAQKRAKTACHCINLRRAANTITKLYDSGLGEIGLSGNQFYLLVSLSENDSASVTELANYVGLERSTLVRTLKPLIEAGYVQDLSGQSQRNRILHLTETGMEKVRAGKVIWEDLQVSIEEKLGTDNVAVLEKILEGLDDYL